MMMNFPKLLAIIAIVLFGIIAIAIFFKEDQHPGIPIESTVYAPLEVELDKEIRIVASVEPMAKPEKTDRSNAQPEIVNYKTALPLNALAEADRIEQLFNKNGPRLPIVETITYKSRVD